MKLTPVFAALLVVLASAFAVNAQQADPSRIKILPTLNEGVIKILYAIKADETVQIRFFSDGRVVKTDRINGGPYTTGLSKKYDVSRIDHRDYWVEVSSADIKVMYHITPSADGKSFVSHLQTATYPTLSVAKK